jgi:small subunit ribosomal protein S11
MKYIIHVNRTKRNSIFNLTDLKGNTLLQYSVGMLGYSGTKKKSSIIHYGAALEFAKKLKEKNYNNIQIHFNGKKTYRKTILNAFNYYKINFEKKIIDKTPIAYNGCKKKKKK